MNQSQGSLFSKLLVPLIIVVIVVYLIASAWAGLRNPYQFTVAYADTMETSVTTSGWVVRSEQTVSGAEGVVQLLRNQGEKVGKGQAIAMVYQSETDVESQAELIQLEEDLEALQYATNAESPSGTVLDSQILSAMSSLRNASSTGAAAGVRSRNATAHLAEPYSCACTMPIQRISSAGSSNCGATSCCACRRMSVRRFIGTSLLVDRETIDTTTVVGLSRTQHHRRPLRFVG